MGELRRVAGAMKIRQVLDDDEVPLTQRETQVLRHVALGLSNKEIGRSLEISVETRQGNTCKTSSARSPLAIAHKQPFGPCGEVSFKTTN